MPLTFMMAVATYEGFYVLNSRAARNRNPGNLNFEPWLAKQYGAVLETIPPGVNEQPRFAAFSRAWFGWEAMKYLLTRDYLGLTFAAALTKWAPAADGNAPAEYIAAVCEITGLPSTTVLTAALLAG
jgi:hypothetical protein